MGYYLIQYMLQDQKSLKIFKEEFTKYDLIVGNMFTRLAILPINTKILKDCFNQLVKLHKNPFFSQLFAQLKGGGMPLSDGQAWRRKRRIISEVFHFDFLNQMIPQIKNQTQQTFSQLNKNMLEGKSIDLLYAFSNILSSIVAKCFFGTDMKEYKIEGKIYFEYLIETINQLARFGTSWQHIIFRMKFYNLSLTKKNRQLKKRLNLLSSVAKQIIQKQIEKIKSKKQTKKNILSTLYEKRLLNEQQNKHDPNKYSISQLIGEFFAFFIAGTDTTSNSLNLLFHYLSQNRQYIEKIQRQLIDLKLQQKLKQVNQSQKLKNMKWSQAVFNQTLRINGPSSGLLSRVTSQDMILGGLQIPKNSPISLFPLINEYKQQNFTNPYQFAPQRWLQNQKIDPYAFIPFSAGQRNCIGQYLSRIQAKIIIEYIISNYQFKSNKPIKMSAQFVYCTKFSDFQMKIKNPVI